jgi:hypothetical protein
MNKSNGRLVQGSLHELSMNISKIKAHVLRWGCNSMVEHLPSMSEAPGSIPSTTQINENETYEFTTATEAHHNNNNNKKSKK